MKRKMESEPNPLVSARLTRGFVNKTGTIDANLQNVGGRMIIDQINRNHAENLKQSKPRIDNSLPWAYRVPGARELHRYNHVPILSVSLGTPLNSTRAPLSPKKSARLSPIKSSVQSNQKKGHKNKEKENIDVVINFTKEEQEIYDKFVEFLTKRQSYKEVEKIIKSVKKETQERILLTSYSGIERYFDGIVSENITILQPSPIDSKLEENKPFDLVSSSNQQK
ncbi:hypothetical protein ABK040_009262 [Willaertia magna]